MPSQKEIVVSHIDMILEYTLKSRASGEEGGGTFLVSPCKYKLLLARGRGGGQTNPVVFFPLTVFCFSDI